MGLIQLQNAAKQFGGQIVLSDVTLDLHTGETAALVGANGVGKTTLFRLITGEHTPDLGTVTRSKGLDVGYLSQEPDVTEGKTLREAVAEAFADVLELEHRLHELAEQMAAEHEGPELHTHMAEYDRLTARFEIAGGYHVEQRLHEVLGGLGFTTADYDLPVSALSGGQKCRAALAKLLLQERQFLLLDEPTNHLDIDAVRWLEKFLAGHHGGAVVISHDRYLLDRIAQRTIEVADGRIEAYPGNYTQFIETRELRRLTQERQYEKDRAFIEKEQAYIAKNIAAQRTNQAKGRRTRLARRLAAGEFTLDKRPGETRAAKIEFTDPGRKVQVGKEVVRIEGLRKQYGEKVLFTDLSLEVYAGQRLGITGPNGTGKTTLLRILLDQVPADAGTVKLSSGARIGYFAQASDELDLDDTIVGVICKLRPGLLERDARHYAARFLFYDEDPFKRIGQLSGGEQSRVRFMKLILEGPDLLVLDEPTNHLDIPSREALENALAEFAGTIIAVSHDRYFLDQTVEKLLVMRPEGTRLFQGNYSYYIEQIERERTEEEAALEAARQAQRRRTSSAKGRTGRGTATPTSPFARMKLSELETYITEHEERLAALQPHFGDPEVYRDPERIQQLRAEFDALSAELAAAEQAWLERAEKS